MKISLPGVLERAATRCESASDWQTKQLGDSLRLLLDHLRLVRAKPQRLNELLSLWTDSEAETRPPTPQYIGDVSAAAAEAINREGDDASA